MTKRQWASASDNWKIAGILAAGAAACAVGIAAIRGIGLLFGID